MAAGDTPREPLVPTAPMPGWIAHESALVELQERVTDPPCGMLAGSAVIETEGIGFVVTITVAVSAAVPPAPVAVIVYVVVAVGDTVAVPLILTVPIP